jgi:Polyketide cyclase / dehydrase and lipid transport
MTRGYEFRTVWRVPGTVDEVIRVLVDVEALPEWWPSVYLRVHIVAPGSSDGVGGVVDFHTKGWLPYTLRWRSTALDPVSASGFALSASGDLEGEGRWSFVQDGPEVEIVYDWRVHATKPLLRRLDWLFRPAFEANHRWAMARGEESLKLELRRRRVVGPDASDRIPPPPRATFRPRRRPVPHRRLLRRPR